MSKKRATIFLFCFALFLEFATTEYNLSIGTVGEKTVKELNPVFYSLGKTRFWTVFFGLSALLLIVFLCVENWVKSGSCLPWGLSAAYVVIWSYTAVRFGFAIFNLWQLWQLLK